MNTLAAKWYEFQRRTIDPAVSGQQLQDLKIAFYSGAMVMLALQREQVLNKVTEKEAIKALSDWHNEITEFGKTCIIKKSSIAKRKK